MSNEYDHALVTNKTTIKISFVLLTMINWMVQVIDVKRAFLKGKFKVVKNVSKGS
jgi:hypothetical protein